jgi:hypothetical protein
MSDRSSKEKSAEVHSSRHFEDDERRKPLTTRTVEIDFQGEISASHESVDKTKIYIEEPDTLTPHFTANNYLTPQNSVNPFSKKYSDHYMSQMY